MSADGGKRSSTEGKEQERIASATTSTSTPETPEHATPPDSISTPNSPTSPELKDVDLTELSLDDDEPTASRPLDEPVTARPPPEEPEVDTTLAWSASAASPPSPSTLDALLSPTNESSRFPTRDSIRDSVAASDTTDDEQRFSTVLLSARQSLDPAHKETHPALLEDLHEETLEEVDAALADDGPAHVHGDRRDTLDGNDIVRMVHQNRVHKKTASTSTIVSANNVPFIVARAEGREEDRRASADGMQKLQERFGETQNTRSDESFVDWNFWGEVVSDYQGYAAAHPEELAKAIERGIPKTLRGMIWQLMSASKEAELEQTYLRLLKETSPHEKAISRDLGRTFPHHAFFTEGHGIGQENLFNVLKAYSLYDSEVGYCQGLPFVVAILLLNMPDEEAFCLLVRLMHSYDLRGHFLPEMPKLQQRMFQFDRLVEDVLPVLHFHFIRQGIKSSMYCSQWFLTMFSYKFPLDIVFRIYDNVLASGIEALFSFSLVLLFRNEETLLNLKFDQLLVFLNSSMLDLYQIDTLVEGDSRIPVYDIDQLVQDAVSMNITPFMLDQFASEYEDLVRTRDAHAREMDNLRMTNRNLSAQVNRLEDNLAQLNAEHVKILNELVMARLRHEELEGELVRYKLLYAEAMHQSEDAMSSHRVSRMSLFSRRSSNQSGS